jgi:exodeoxyribonuclease VII small subunit
MTESRETNGSSVDEQMPSYEEARDELASVVRALETGGVTLEESLALWERGERLAQICEQWLEGARARLNAVVAADDPDVAEPETRARKGAG